MFWTLLSCLSSQKSTPVSASSFTHPLEKVPTPIVGPAGDYIPPTIISEKTKKGRNTRKLAAVAELLA